MQLTPASAWSGTIPVVAFDLDSTLFDWGKRLNEILLELDPDYPIITPGSQIHFSHLSGPTGCPDTLREAMSHPSMYHFPEAYPGAAEAVRATYIAGYRVMFLSTPDPLNEQCMWNKQNHIRFLFGNDAVNHLILSHDKTVVNCDILVDDKPTISGLVSPSWVRVMYDQSYNREVNTPLRLTSWENWPNLLEQSLSVKRSKL